MSGLIPGTHYLGLSQYALYIHHSEGEDGHAYIVNPGITRKLRC